MAVDDRDWMDEADHRLDMTIDAINSALGADDLLDLIKAADLPVTPVEPEGYCRHRNFLIDRNARLVWCRECEVEVDAFTALDEIVRSWDQVINRVTRLNREWRGLMESIRELKRIERNAKARVKRAKARLAGLPVEEGERDAA